MMSRGLYGKTRRARLSEQSDRRDPPKPRLMTVGRSWKSSSRRSHSRIDELPTNSTPPDAGRPRRSAAANSSKACCQRAAGLATGSARANAAAPRVNRAMALSRKGRVSRRFMYASDPARARKFTLVPFANTLPSRGCGLRQLDPHFEPLGRVTRVPDAHADLARRHLHVLGHDQLQLALQDRQVLGQAA